MNRTLAYLMSVIAFLAGLAAMRTVRAQETTTLPGQATRASVWIQNRGDAEAVPVVIAGVAPNASLPVEVVGTPVVSIDPRGVARTRAARGAWEYRLVTLSSGQDPVAALAAPGADGWETTGMAFPVPGGTAILLKRPN